MKLLVVCRKLDKSDHLAGFMYRWVQALAREVDELKVICLEKGEIGGIGENVEVAALRKSPPKADQPKAGKPKVEEKEVKKEQPASPDPSRQGEAEADASQGGPAVVEAEKAPTPQ